MLADSRDSRTALSGPLPRPLWALVVSMLLEARGRSLVLFPDSEAMRDAVQWLAAVHPEKRVLELPAWDVDPLDSAWPDPRVLARQARAAEAIWADEWDLLLVEVGARITPLVRFSLPGLRLRTESEIDADMLLARGYRRVREVSAPGEYALRGEIIDCWSPLEDAPVRIERFDVLVEQLRRFDPVSQLGGRPCEHYDLGIAGFPPLDDADVEALAERIGNRARRRQADPLQLERILDALRSGQPFAGRALWHATLLPQQDWPQTETLLVSPAQVAQAEAGQRASLERTRLDLETQGMPFPHLELPPSWSDLPVAAVADGPSPVGSDGLRVVSLPPESARFSFGEQLTRLIPLSEDRRVWLTCQPADQAALERFLPELDVALRARIEVVPARVRGHWDLPDLQLRLVDVSQLLRRRRAGRAAARMRGLDLGDLQAGDLVVHADYGIGRFVGLERIELDGVPIEVVRLHYRDEDSVFVPVTRLDRLEPYRSGADEDPQLDRLGSGQWQKRRSAAKAEMVRFAAELLNLYAAREQASRAPLQAPGPLAAAVEASFPWDETADQLRALEEIESDLVGEHPMDRLLVGDVGYGKTEIALRTVIRFVENGLQAAVLVPTTILAAQHGRTFHERLRDLPVRVGVLSRFTPADESRRILSDLRAGRIDVVIGTHRLLQPDVAFARLGVLVVDEEHRFGVRHKEALKSLRRDLDCLSMSATPIPRTLQMHLGGLRPMSMIATPPANRLGVETQAALHDDDLIRDALQRERARGGQAFVLRNRIDALDETARHLQQLVPELRIGIVHGKMRPREVEQVFLDFLEHRIDALVATSIIESGLDFPRANTLIVLDAHLYGLAELYQLRGRVGRSDRRAFAYLLHPDPERLPPKSLERLEVLRSFSNLGGGFHIAMRDLEIRGAGELLGGKQAGQIRSVGLGTALRLLEEAVREAHGQSETDRVDPEIKGNMPLVLSDHWIPEPVERLRAYQRLSVLETQLDADRALVELEDRYGAPGAEDRPFLDAMRLQPLLRAAHVREARFAGQRLSLFLAPSTPLDPLRLLSWAQARSDVVVREDRIVLQLPLVAESRPEAAAVLLREILQTGLADPSTLE